MQTVALAVLVLLVGPSVAFGPLSTAVSARMRSNADVGSSRVDHGVRAAHRVTSAASASSTGLFAATSSSAPAPAPVPAPAAAESSYERCERYAELLKGPRWGGPVLGPVVRYLNVGMCWMYMCIYMCMSMCMCCLIRPYAQCSPPFANSSPLATPSTLTHSCMNACIRTPELPVRVYE